MLFSQDVGDKDVPSEFVFWEILLGIGGICLRGIRLGAKSSSEAIRLRGIHLRNSFFGGALHVREIGLWNSSSGGNSSSGANSFSVNLSSEFVFGIRLCLPNGFVCQGVSV